MEVKIAVVSDEGKTISQHFGRAAYYIVLTIVDGRITKREQRDKLGHKQFASDQHVHSQQGSHEHGFSPVEQDHHTRMLEGVRDCQILLARGMGSGAYYSIQQAGITPIITTIVDIDEAALAAAKGTLEDHTEKLH